MTQRKWVNISGPFTDEFPFLKEGELRRVVADGTPLCIALIQSQYYAVADRCPHAGARLSEGWCKDNYIVCPLHRLHFDIHTGKALTDTCSIEKFTIEHREDGLYVEMPVSWWKLW